MQPDRHLAAGRKERDAVELGDGLARARHLRVGTAGISSNFLPKFPMLDSPNSAYYARIVCPIMLSCMPGIFDLPIMPKIMPAYSGWPYLRVRHLQHSLLQLLGRRVVAAQLKFESKVGKRLIIL